MGTLLRLYCFMRRDMNRQEAEIREIFLNLGFPIAFLMGGNSNKSHWGRVVVSPIIFFQD